jgi:hypothetical protein
MAGWDWIVGFKNRNPDICFRKPEATSAARNVAFNEPHVTILFNVYEGIQKKYNISPTRICSVDYLIYTPFRKHNRYWQKLEENRLVFGHVQTG